MDITTLAAWGEFIGGIAVVVSLIYLASQIRQNSKLLQVSTTVAIANSMNLSTSAIMDEPSLIRMWTIETAEFEALPEIEQARLGAFVTKAVSPEPRKGNPPERVVETPSGMLNASTASKRISDCAKSGLATSSAATVRRNLFMIEFSKNDCAFERAITAAAPNMSLLL